MDQADDQLVFRINKVETSGGWVAFHLAQDCASIAVHFHPPAAGESISKIGNKVVAAFYPFTRPIKFEGLAKFAGGPHHVVGTMPRSISRSAGSVDSRKGLIKRQPRN